MDTTGRQVCEAKQQRLQIKKRFGSFFQLDVCCWQIN